MIDNLISVLDTQRFGFKVVKLDFEQVDAACLIQAMRKDKVKFCIYRVSLDNLDFINLLENLGFEIKDVQVTYRYNLSDPLPDHVISSSNEVIIRDAIKRDINEIVSIARDAFSDYGHYAADKNIPKGKLKEIYGDWAKRSVEDKNTADKVILAEINNEIAGFLSFKIKRLNETITYAAGGLGCVSEKYRKQNIFRLITYEGLKWGIGEKFSWVEHNALVTNFPVNATFSKLGFKIYKSFATLHYWLKNDPI